MTTNKEKKAVYDKKRRTENPEYHSKKSMEWAKANPEKRRLYSKRHWYKRSYGISLEEYEEKLKLQHHCCAICGKHESNFQRQLAVDHCHTTGKIRDLLCPKCNLAFGYVDEDITIIERLLEYAKKHTLHTT